ncbi:MAG: TonB family protein [Pyrinomonadaceae bacterium]|nr:TonB family protein [Pyrinomonadaceae bacterium]
MLSFAVFCQIGQAQQAQQLSLADVLIGLRSKKATLHERNKLLSDAVKVRGVTFALTPEIETELAGTGASKELVEAVREKSLKDKAALLPKPISTPIPDSAFYRQRADENVGKGDFDLAVSDYTRAIELNPKDAAIYLNRGRAYWNKKSFDLAALDYDKTIELDPKAAAAYFNRGDLHEKRGNVSQAMRDYQKAVELDAGNESAKNNLKRLQDEQAKIEQAKLEQAKLLAQSKEAESKPAAELPKVPEQSIAPKSIELGSLVGLAVKMVTPVYPATARQMSINGQVMVQLTLDETGDVSSVRATTGPQILRAAGEDAARRSKFKPAMVGGQAVKATGFIVYNFTNK